MHVFDRPSPHGPRVRCTSFGRSGPGGCRPMVSLAVQQIHDRCAIYTAPAMASRLLDLAGWTEDVDLSSAILLEPCVGEGAIIVEGVRRLVRSLLARGLPLDLGSLRARIRGFEFHSGAVRTARTAVRRLLIDHGLDSSNAGILANDWIQERDFLLEPFGAASHVVANPPYLRWSKLPSSLATTYRSIMPAMATRGDLAVAFLHRMTDWAGEDGEIVALVSDRWMYAQYGAEFVQALTADGWRLKVIDDRPTSPFVEEVGAYSAIVSLSKRVAAKAEEQRALPRAAASELHEMLLARHGSIVGADCMVRVGPALGAGRTFLPCPGEIAEIEPELLRPFLQRDQLDGGEVRDTPHRVAVPYDSAGRLIDIENWPGFGKWVRRHEQALRARARFANSDDWWRTIDSVPAIWAEAPKLLLPELCREARTTLDAVGAVPAHSLYAIWPGHWPAVALQRVLNAGLLELTAIATAPRLKHGWFRFYKRFLVRTPLPRWMDLSQADRNALMGCDVRFAEVYRKLFDHDPGKVPQK